MPLTNPVTSQVNAPPVVHDLPPGLAVTTYPDTADPPSDTGATHDTATLRSPATPTTPDGAPGTPRGTTATASEAAPAPAAFTARSFT